MAIEAGDAIWKIKGDLGNLEKDLNEGTRKVEQATERVGLSATQMGVGMAAAGAAIVGGMGLMMNSYLEAGDQVEKMSYRTGFAVESLSELKHAAEQSGTSLESIEKASKKMAQTIYEAGEEAKKSSDGTGTYTEALAALGLKYDDLAGLKPEEQFYKISMALADVDDHTKKAALAQEIFGRAGTELLPLLAEGSNGIAALREEARTLGIVFDQETAEAAVVLGDNIENLGKSLTGVKNTIAEALVPVLNELVPWITENIIKVREWADAHPELTSNITLAAGAVGAFLVTVGPALIIIPSLSNGVTLLGNTLLIATPKVVAFTAACAPWVIGIGAVTLAIGALALTIKEAMEYNEQWVAARAAENEALEAEAKLRTQLTDMGYKSANDVVIARLEERLRILQDAGQKSLEMSGKVSQEMLDQELALTESLKGAYQRRGGEIPPIHQKLYDSVRYLAEQGGIEQVVVAKKTGEAMVDANSETAKELERIAEDQAEVRAKYNLEQEQELMKAAEKSTEFLEQIAAGYHKWKIVVGTKLSDVVDILRAFNVSYKAQWAIAVEATDNAATEIENRFAILEGNIAGRAAMLAKSIGEMLDSVSGSAAAASSGGAAVESGNQGANVNMNVNLNGVTVSNEMDLASLGKKLGASIASKLQTAGVML